MLTDDILQKAVFVVAFLIAERVEALGKHAKGLLLDVAAEVACTLLTLLTSLGADSSGGGEGETELETWGGF